MSLEFIGIVLVILALPVCLGLGVAGFVIGLGQRNRARRADQRLAALEYYVGALHARLGAGPAAPAAGPEAAPFQAGPAPAGPQPAPTGPGPATPSAASPVPAALGPSEPRPTEPARGPVPAITAAAAPPRPRAEDLADSLEERLGSRWAVWVGGVALALGGVFLVRYSIEQGLLGPGARVALGAVFALLLIAAGEWMRRRDPEAAAPLFASAHVPAVLTAAGTATAFATVYAAHALYGLIPGVVALVLLGLVALVTMAASALHGPALAALGLVGALGAPLLVQSAEPAGWPLVLYLAFVVAAADALARLRLWRPLALAAAVGALLWGVLLAPLGDTLPAMGHVVVQTGLAALFLAADPHRTTPDAEAWPDRLATGVFPAFAVLAVFVVGWPQAVEARTAFAGIMGLLLLLTGFRFAPAAAACAAAALVVVGALLAWPVAREAAAEPVWLLPDLLTASPRPLAVRRFLTFGALSLGLVAAAGLVRVARGRGLPIPTAAWYLAAATLGPLSGLVAAFWRVSWWEASTGFTLAALALALAYMAAAAWLRRREMGEPDAVRLGVGATAAAALAALALGLTFALERGLLTVSLSLAALGTAWVSERARIPALRYAVGAIGAVVLARLAYDPLIVADPGRTPVLNWLLVGYGVPALSFGLAARILERGGRDRVVRLVEGLALVFAALLATFEIRHAVNDGNPFAAGLDHLELGLFATLALSFAVALAGVEARRPDVVSRVGALVSGAVALVVAGPGLLLFANPLFTGEPVLGGRVVNSLLAAYLLPAVLAGALAWVARGRPPRWYARLAAGLALLLHLAWMVDAIRRWFGGPLIDLDQPTGQGELWSYSLALLATGLALLAAGFLRGSRALRLVSALYVIAAVVKVFAVDLSNLEGVTRALSFIGLGLALVGVGLVYQRALRRRPGLANGGSPAS